MESLFLPLTLLLMALPLILLIPLYSAAKRKTNEQLADIEPLLLQWGFQRTSLFEQMRQRFLYKTTQSSFSIYISLKDLPHGNTAQKSLTFLIFWVEMPINDSFFMRTPNLESEENDILYETYWKRVPSDVLAPLGLRILCAPTARSDFERRILSEPAQTIFTGLVAQKDLFYIYGDSDNGLMELGFALPRSTEPERLRRWFDATKNLARLLQHSTQQAPNRRRKQFAWLLMIFFVLVHCAYQLFVVSSIWITTINLVPF